MPFSIVKVQGRQILKLEGAVTIRHAQDLAAKLLVGLEDSMPVEVDTSRIGGHRHLYPSAIVFAAQDGPGAFLR